MFLAYVDESGDTGAAGSQTFVLGCVLVRASKWPDAFNDMIAFRRFLKSQFRVPVRAEIKANYLVRNGGPFREIGLGDIARRDIYRAHMRLQAKLGISSFAIVIDKKKLYPDIDPFEKAWTFLLQRLERLSTTNHDGVMLIHDEGEAMRVRAFARHARRAGIAKSLFGTGTIKVPFSRLIDDPVPRVSSQSYFLQMADLCAYAAYRRIHPPPAGKTHVVPQSMWDELGAARFADANKLAGGPSVGIVLWPK